MKQQLEKYAEIKAIIAKYEAELEELKPAIIQVVEEMNPADKTVETDFGTFSMVSKRKYTYPAEIEAAETALKQSKKEAEAKGTAPYVENPYLLFKPKANA